MTLPRPDRDSTDGLAADQVRAHVAYVRLAALGTAMVASLLAMALWDVVDHRAILAWLLCLTPPFVWRFALVQAFHHEPNEWSATDLLRRFRATFALHGIGWGLASALIFPPDIAHQSFLAFTVGGITAGSVTMTAFDLVAGLLFLVIAVVPLSVRLLVAGGHINSTMGLMLAGFLVYMIINAVRVHRRYVEIIALRRATSERAESLAAFQASLATIWRTGADDSQNVLRAVAREAAASLALDRVMIWLFDSPQDALTLRAADGRHPLDVAAEPVLRLSRAPNYLAALGQVTNDPTAHARPAPYAEFAHTMFAPDADMARMDIPLRAAGQIEGVLCCERPATQPWTREEAGFATTVATLALAAIEEARRRLAERRLRELNENLEQLVLERTAALQDSEQRFRAVFAESPVMIALIRVSDQKILEANNAAFEAFGFTPNEGLGKTSLDLNLWVDPQERERVVDQIQRQGFVSDLEFQMRRKDGSVFWALVNSSLVTIGGETCRLTTLQDVSERRHLEARFLQSQKMEVVGHLAGGIAHDFNNVLTVITSTAELAMADRTAGPVRDALETIRDAGGRAAGLTRQLLAFGRRQILQPAVLDVNDVVIGLGPMLRRVVGEHVAIDTRLASDAVTIIADRGSLEQVILNLAINSHDAMPTGGALTIETARVIVPDSPSPSDGPRAGGYVTLAVRDTGVGMDQAVLDRMFEPFFTTKEQGKGTGLGLSTAYGIVNQCGGSIDVRSTPGLGTTFTVYLPWVDQRPQSPRAAPTSRGGTEVILAVDDDRDIRDVVQRALTSAGYTVRAAASGEDALRALEELHGAVDLLVTDVIMPGMSGRQLAERTQSLYPKIRVLYTSGYADDAIAEQGVLADGVQFLAKPYSLKALTARVRDVLDA